jgi:hypothetical protein
MSNDPSQSREESYLEASEYLVNTSGVGEMSEHMFGVPAEKMAVFAALMGMILEETRDSDCTCDTCVKVRDAVINLESNRG